MLDDCAVSSTDCAVSPTAISCQGVALMGVFLSLGLGFVFSRLLPYQITKRNKVTDLKRALRMDSPTQRLSEGNLRKLSKGFSRSAKKSRLSAVSSDVECCSLQDGGMNGRSASLSTLLPSGVTQSHVGASRHRPEKLQTVEAKMAGIEVSLNSRKRREVLLDTLPRAARELVKELDSMQQSISERDQTIQSLRTQITNMGGSVKGVSGSPVRYPLSPCDVISTPERVRVHERIHKVQQEIDSKRVAVKNLRLSLGKSDVTDNIDMRIRAAETEYELEREELNILNLKEEVSILQCKLQEATPSSHPANGPPLTLRAKITGDSSLFSILSGSDTSTGLLVAVNVRYDVEKPPFGISVDENNVTSVLWASDDTGLKKEDRLVEINGKVTVGQNVVDVKKELDRNSNIQLVVLRFGDVPSLAPPTTPLRRLERQLEERCRDIKELQSRLERSQRERENLKGESLRLTHRISYLEDHISELQVKQPKETKVETSEAIAPPSPGSTVIQVYQKGQQTLAVAKASQDCKKYPTLSHDRNMMSPNRRTSSSSGKSSTYYPSYDSSSSGYASYRSSTSQSNHRDVAYESDGNRTLTRPNSSAEHRRPRRMISPKPDSIHETNSNCCYRSSKPMPPKKPERLSIQRAASLLSVDQVLTSKNCENYQSDRLKSSQTWKSTAGGLNDPQYSDTLSSYSSISSRKIAKRRLDMNPRSEFSPTNKSSVIYDSPAKTVENIPQENSNETYNENSHSDCRSKVENGQKIENDASSPMTSTSSGSSFHTASGSVSPCSARVHPSPSPRCSNENVLPSPSKQSSHSAQKKSRSSSAKSNKNNDVHNDITLVHAEPTYAYIPNRNDPVYGTNINNSISKIPNSISYRHNMQKYHQNLQFDSIYRASTPNGPNGHRRISVQEHLGSPKKRTPVRISEGAGRTSNGSPRNNSSMKLSEPHDVNDNWC